MSRNLKENGKKFILCLQQERNNVSFASFLSRPPAHERNEVGRNFRPSDFIG